MFVFGSLKDFSASCSWAASSSNSFSHPSAVHFRIPLPFIFAFLCRLPSVCRLPLLRVVGRQHSVLAVLSVEHELRLWKKRTLCAFCYSFPSLEWSLWLFYLLLLLSPMTFSVYRLIVLRIVFWCLRRDRVSFNMLWCWFITFYVAFYSCLHLRGIRGRQPDRQGGVRLRRIDAVGNVA